ncbi:putative vegetative cell wall protein gp1-like isoform X5 [Iris pallida]|uniref:Vegetative cell wall protein gp1-like isoform X5 n=1 Tax=Iris pallida TaxID=29817 RepID=A0AAX6FHM1_IRIPA|nr:putative vegetative cell wall protein gp1-like isoform X5 [Iris pallida]
MVSPNKHEPPPLSTPPSSAPLTLSIKPPIPPPLSSSNHRYLPLHRTTMPEPPLPDVLLSIPPSPSSSTTGHPPPHPPPQQPTIPHTSTTTTERERERDLAYLAGVHRPRSPPPSTFAPPCTLELLQCCHPTRSAPHLHLNAPDPVTRTRVRAASSRPS